MAVMHPALEAARAEPRVPGRVLTTCPEAISWLEMQIDLDLVLANQGPSPAERVQGAHRNAT
jgi:hypothetical protein